MITLTTTIQEISLQAYAFGVFDYLFNKRNMSRDEILNLFEHWGREFEGICRAHTDEDDWFYYDEVDAFINRKFDEMKLRDNFPCGIAVGDFISYEGGIYKITGTSDSGILVKEIKPRPENKNWVVVEIGCSQAEKIKILPGYDDYEEIMDTTNGHDPELVRKINIAWNEKREQFCPILRAFYARDIKEIMESDAWNWTGDVESVKETLHDEWDFHADNYLMHIADDWDLKAILYYLRYEA